MSTVRRTLPDRPKLSPEKADELRALDASQTDEGIDYSDAPSLSWDMPVQARFYRPIKKPVTLRLDADVLHWLKRGGQGYQTRLNAILREAMLRELRQLPAQAIDPVPGTAPRKAKAAST